jgi:hypothetical protein
MTTAAEVHLPDLMHEMWGIPRSYARRILASGAARLDGDPITDVDVDYDRVRGRTLKFGQQEIYFGHDGGTFGSAQAAGDDGPAQQLDPLDLSGAAEAAAATVRRRLVDLSERLATEQDPAAIRDIAIGLAALGSAVEALDDLAQRELLHKSTLANWRDDLRLLLEQLTGCEWDCDLEYREKFPTVRVCAYEENERIPPLGHGERLLTGHNLYPLRAAIATLNDRLHGWEA